MEQMEYLILKWSLGTAFVGAFILFFVKLLKLLITHLENGHLWELLKEVVTK